MGNGFTTDIGIILPWEWASKTVAWSAVKLNYEWNESLICQFACYCVLCETVDLRDNIELPYQDHDTRHRGLSKMSSGSIFFQYSLHVALIER